MRCCIVARAGRSTESSASRSTLRRANRRRRSWSGAEERFQAAARAVSDLIWTNNARGEMEGEQPAWAALTGQSYEEYQGYGWAKAVHPDDAQATVDAWNEAVRERQEFFL